MLERWHRIKLWYTITVIGFLLTLSLYGILLRASYVVLQLEPAYRRNPENFTFVYPIGALPLGDYTKLIDLRNFHFTIFNDVCNETIPPLLLILVHSSPTNFGKRKLIRETWGQPRERVKLLFTLGAVRNGSLQRELVAENAIHHDFVQGTFIDAYRNMTYKHVMVLKYAIYHCPDVKYVLKTDDDIFVNIEATLSFIQNALSPKGVSNLLLCRVVKKAKVFRSYRSKWRVSVAEYPLRAYPTYCLGFAILYSPDVLFELYKISQSMQYFWIDDVHVTGNAVVGTNITHTDVSPLIIHINDISGYNIDNFLYGDPEMSLDENMKSWELVEIRHSNMIE